MCKVRPVLTVEHLKDSTDFISKGHGLVAGLPGVEPDAKSMDPKADNANRDLAKRISEAVAAVKPTENGIPRFVLGWRLYPNEASEFWKDDGGKHNCGCGCACYSNPHPKHK